MKYLTVFFRNSIFTILVALLLLSGCNGLFKSSIPGNNFQNRPPVTQQASPLEEAESALARGDYAKSELIAQKLYTDTSLPPEASLRATKVYAPSAAKNRHPHVALKALEQWNSLSPNADSTREWQDVWCEAMSQLSSREARTQANEIYHNTKRAPSIRGVAGIFFAIRQWEDGELGQTMEALEAMYKATPDTATHIIFEDRLSLLLHSASSQARSLAASAVKPENKTTFPYNLIAIDYLRKQTVQSANKTKATEALAQLKTQVKLANPRLFDAPALSTSMYTPKAPYVSQPVTGSQVVALALPMSGQYGSIAAKIIEGAKLACAEMSAAGQATSLTVIDTSAPDWETRLAALDTNIVGGPISANDYSIAKSRGLLSKKVFFAFLPSLEGQDEGSRAWRFFTSPEDQIRALLDFTNKLNIKNYASLYPDEPYGRRMTQIFEQRTQSMGLNLSGSAAYTPNVPDGWMNTTGELLSANKTPSSEGFQAVFLPDGWKSSEVLISNIFHFNEPRLVLLGTSLWEQGLTGQSTFNNPQNYTLSVFPGNWNAITPSAAGQKLLAAAKRAGHGADFWTGVGYDYARMAISLGIQQGWTPASVTASLQNLSLGWSIAPLRWDSTGRAAQDLFLFTPVEGLGFAPVDSETFTQNYSTMWQQNQQ